MALPRDTGGLSRGQVIRARCYFGLADFCIAAVVAQMCGLHHAACYWAGALVGLPVGVLSGPAQYLAQRYRLEESLRWFRRDGLD